MKFNRTGLDLIDDYAEMVLDEKVRTGKRLKKGIRQQLKRISDSKALIDAEKAHRAVELIEDYFEMKLTPMELYVIGLIHCFNANGTVLFSRFLIVMGRGNGKSKFSAAIAWYLTTKAYGINGYNVDIIANNEEQAKEIFGDVYQMLEDKWDRCKQSYSKTRQRIYAKSTRSYIKYNTSNARTKDGKRSACLIFDEVHEYESSANIRVFSSGLGKRPHWRIFEITTRGYVVDGVLDDELKLADRVLNGEIKEDIGLAALIYEIDKEEQGQDENNWVMANPNLPYLPELKKIMKSEFVQLPFDTTREQEFYTKRLNFPKVDKELAVANRAQLEKASRAIPENMEGWTCVGGIDYAMLSDMASCGLLFRNADEFYYIQHSWIYEGSSDWERIRIKDKFPEWVSRGDLTVVPKEDVQISPDLLRDWLIDKMTHYRVQAIGIDLARWELTKEMLREVGFCKENGNLCLMRPLDIVAAVPVIDSWMRTGALAFGDVPLMRNAASNTKKIRMKSQFASGNYRYDKIEPRSRKNDAWMAFTHAVACYLRRDDQSSNNATPVMDLPFLEF